MTDWILPFLCGLGASILSAWGVGGGTLLLLVMTLFLDIDQRTAQGINLLFFLPCALLAMWRYRKEGLLQFPILLPMMLFGSAGVVLGRLAAMWMGTQWVKWCFGAVLIPLGFKELFHKKQSTEKSPKK